MMEFSIKSILTDLSVSLSELKKNPNVLFAQLYGHSNYYKIKLRASGCRLVYKVIDNELVILVIEIRKRERGYISAALNSTVFSRIIVNQPLA